MNKSKLIILFVLACAIGAFFYFDGGQYLTLDFLKSQQGTLDQYYRDNPTIVIAAYFVIYVVVTGLSLPGAAILTLAGGAIFGLVAGTIIVSFASTIGATLAFLAARFLLKESIQEKFGKHLQTFNKGIEDDGAFYLFTLRLVPVVPFFVINLVMGLTPLRTVTFYWVSQLGMLAGTAVYVNAGTELAKIDSLQGIISFNLIFAFVLLGIFPLVARFIVKTLKGRVADESSSEAR